jgi:hypothetical protein
MKPEPFKMTVSKKGHTRVPLENLGSGFDTGLNIGPWLSVTLNSQILVLLMPDLFRI